MPDPTILLIEDNEQNAYLARFLLQQAGCAVVTARTGQEGLEKVRSAIPDLILLDIQLPDTDGYQIAQRLREDPAVRHIPIVALTSFAMPGEKKRALELGCRGYIEKPIEAGKFAQQVKAFLPSAGDAR